MKLNFPAVDNCEQKINPHFQLTQEIKDLLAASNLTGKSEPSDPESGCSVDPDSGKPVDPDPEPVSKESDPNSNTLDQELIPETCSS